MTAQALQDRIDSFSKIAPGAICDRIKFRILSVSDDTAEFVCATESWMCNTMGMLHGGIGVTILDQAMSIVAHCSKLGQGNVPAIELNASFHRPIVPGEDVRVEVRILSVSNSFIRLSAEAMQRDKLCISTTGTYFQKHN